MPAPFGPYPNAVLRLPNGQQLRAGDPVVTYGARNLEPYRGFHQFMRALPRLLAAHPTCQVVVVGGDDVSYGSKPKDAPNWRTKLLRENPVDPNRVHFLGKVPYATYQKVLQVSAVHVYLTYPFVLSWSLLEALACGCLVIASDTAPVQEIICDKDNGLLVDFFNTDEIAERVLYGLTEPEAYKKLRKAAYIMAKRYSIEHGNEHYFMSVLVGNHQGRGSAEFSEGADCQVRAM
ncbi:glycosyltransferase [Stutzerimonas stutzeri]|uniref:glycosyltransferase n=1 Tax=Stutzerimonas stutzeri TaxID=316 RepID=UPI0009BD645A|nr:glycosyltransferase [Stutzerimonas stutzeri]